MLQFIRLQMLQFIWLQMLQFICLQMSQFICLQCFNTAAPSLVNKIDNIKKLCYILIFTEPSVKDTPV